MSNKSKFILGIYLAISVGVSGFYYINPERRDGYIYGHENSFDYEEFKYSILFSVVGFILLYSYLRFYRKNDANSNKK